MGWAEVGHARGKVGSCGELCLKDSDERSGLELEGGVVEVWRESSFGT